MPRGGHREKSGRKSTWKSGCKFEDTKLIRVPRAIADQLLEIAHKIDTGESLDLVTKENADSLNSILARWRHQSESYSMNNTRWSKVRVMLDEIEISLGIKGCDDLVLGALDVEAPPDPPSRLRITELAFRLAAGESTVRLWHDKLSHDAFIQKTRSKDPQGIGWRFEPLDRYCYPVLN